MAALKKGVVSTLAVLFLVLVILSISFLTFKQGIIGKKAIAENNAMEIAKNKFLAVQYAIYQMFWNSTGINITLSSSGMFFTHSVPPSIGTFTSDVSSFRNYLASTMPELQITPNMANSNITFQYNDFADPRLLYKYNILAGSPNQVNLDFDPAITMYEFRIHSPDFNGTPVFARVTTGSVNVSVVVTGSGNYFASTGALINPASALTDSAAVVSGLSNMVNISISFSKFTISDYLGAPGNLTLTTVINITDIRDIYLPTAIFVNESIVWKNGTPRVY